jgi:aspartyl-tRNA(Asn)/glutamyl-tRNA(Gln) amidotransferase subunit A
MFELSARELIDGYRARELSPLEVIDALAARIEELDPRLGAFTTLCLDRAREEAKAYRADDPRPLAGVPIGVKDLFDSEGVRTTYGSPMFAGHVPRADAAALARARAAGAILVGKTQTHEFAWGITSVNPLMGTSVNPWSLDRISGGSSGGSAVALAAGLVPLALGSDTGGSIRVPSSFCGTAGLKPTYGLVSREGIFPLAPSLDHPGPMARRPDDAALLLAAIADDVAPDDGMRRIGVYTDLLVKPPFDVVEVELPEAELAYPTFVPIQRAEALFTHRSAGLWPARRDEYGDDVRSRLEAAETVTLEDYLRASEDGRRLAAGFARAFRDVDLLLTPITAGSPPPIGDEGDLRDRVMPYTVPQDLAGLPACAVRAGFDALGLPVGVQLTGPPGSDARVLAAAQELYEATADVQAAWPLSDPRGDTAAPQARGDGIPGSRRV